MNVFNHKRPLRRDNYDLAAALLEFLDRMKARKRRRRPPAPRSSSPCCSPARRLCARCPASPGP